MNKTISETIKVVTDSPSSIFTKEDVIKLLTNVQQQEESFVDASYVANQIRFRITSALRYIQDGCVGVDLDSVEFSGLRNTIKVESAQIDGKAIMDILDADVFSLYVNE